MLLRDEGRKAGGGLSLTTGSSPRGAFAALLGSYVAQVYTPRVSKHDPASAHDPVAEERPTTCLRRASCERPTGELLSSARALEHVQDVQGVLYKELDDLGVLASVQAVPVSGLGHRQLGAGS